MTRNLMRLKEIKPKSSILKSVFKRYRWILIFSVLILTIILISFYEKRLSKAKEPFFADVIPYKPDSDELQKSGATLPLFWHTDRHCRTRLDPFFKVKISSDSNFDGDISCVSRRDLEAEIKFIPLEKFQKSQSIVEIRLEKKLDGIEEDEKFCLILIDPDAPSPRTASARYWLHWISFDINLSQIISGFTEKTCETGSCENIVPFNPPTPPKGSGPHRYQFLLFIQSQTLVERIDEFQKYRKSRADFHPKQFERHFDLQFVASAIFKTESK